MRLSDTMYKYKAVVFDLDGTLLDTSEGIIKSVDYTIAHMGLKELTLEEKRLFIGPPIQHSFKRVYSLDDEKTEMAANIFRKQYSNIDLFEAKVYDGIIELLVSLKENNVKIGVATYKREDYAAKILTHFGIDVLCDSIQGSDYEGVLTKQDIIDNCISELQVDKETVLMVGDTDNDKIGAERAGVDFLGVGYGFGYKAGESSLDLFASTVSDIKNFIYK